ncbi:MAG TPA: cytochrome D1 domain-containing protein [Pyrinomonadaceae bacterium]|nr:cytochrome D1 domain-containing protein [Pyrinomonadaceae bacterium]HMP64427.1 cytochrome D1 domain-containing protein [Pyrinomonadaceae bacterium]
MNLRYFILLLFLFALGNGSAAAQTASPIMIVLNKADNDAVFVDPVAMKVLGKVAVGTGPHEVVFSEDGRLAFAVNYGAQTPGNSISVLDVAARKELRRVDLGPLMRPHGIQVIGGKAYFTAETNRAIARYDPEANKVDWIMGTGQNGSHMIAGSRDQRRFYTANIGSDTVTAFMFQNVPPAGSQIVQIPTGRQPEAIDMSPDGKEVWVGLNQDGGIDVIDTATNKVVRRVDLGGRPYRVRFTPDGKYVVNPTWPSNELIIVDAATKEIVKRIKMESVPFGIDFTRDGKYAFVTAIKPDLVYKVNLETGTIEGSVETGNQPDGIALFGM